MTILLRQKPLPQVIRQIVQRDNGAWFDPEDMSTMFQDAAGTTPVTALEQPVGLMLDKSGNGNHATQSITASRPTLSARYNLLTKTEDFADAAWNKPTTTVTQNYDGIGDKIIPSAISTNHCVFQDITVTSGSSFYSTVKIKASGYNKARLICFYPASPYSQIYATVNLTTGAVSGDSSAGGILSYADGALGGDGYISVYLSGTISAYTTLRFQIDVLDDDGGITFTGDGTKGILLNNPAINIGATLLRYQRVNTTTDYDSVGFPKYLKGDGIDDFFNLPFMKLYGNGACSIVAARDTVSQAADTYIVSERSTTDVDPKYFPSRQLASGGNVDSYIVSDEGTVRLDTTGSAISGAKLAAIHSVVDSGSNIKPFKDGVVVADDNYTRAGTLTLNNTTLGASVSTTTSNYARMQLYGLIITKSALSDTDRRRCEQFFASRLSTLGVTL